VPDRKVARHLTGTIQSPALDNFLLRYVVNPVFGIYWRVIRRLIAW
jgi:hypothetical protein